MTDHLNTQTTEGEKPFDERTQDERMRMRANTLKHLGPIARKTCRLALEGLDTSLAVTPMRRILTAPMVAYLSGLTPKNLNQAVATIELILGYTGGGSYRP